MSAAIDKIRLFLIDDKIRCPMLGWFFIVSHCCGSNGPCLCKILSGIPIFPTSCNGAAKTIKSAISPDKFKCPAIRLAYSPKRLLCKLVS